MNQYENDAADLLAGSLSENLGDEFNGFVKVVAGILQKRDEDVQYLVKELQKAGALQKGRAEAVDAGFVPCFVRPAGDHSGWCLVAESDRAQDAERQAMDFATFVDEDVARFAADCLNAPSGLPSLYERGEAAAEVWLNVKDGTPEPGRYWCFISVQTDLGLSGYQANCSYSDLHGFMENMQPVNVTHYRALMPNPGTAPTTTSKEASQQGEEVGRG